MYDSGFLDVLWGLYNFYFGFSELKNIENKCFWWGYGVRFDISVPNAKGWSWNRFYSQSEGMNTNKSHCQSF